MRKHIQCHEKKTYSCKICKFSTDILKIFHDHTRSIHPKVALICNECSFTAKSEAQLKNHIKRKHSDILFKCKDCNFETGVESKLKWHQKNKHTSLVYNCQICENYQCKSMEAFRNHTVRTHKMKKETRGAVNKQTCTYCGKIPKTKTLYQIHLYWKHTENDLNNPDKDGGTTKKKSTTAIKEEKNDEIRCENEIDIVRDYEDTTNISDDEDESSRETVFEVREDFEYHISDDEEDTSTNIRLNWKIARKDSYRLICPISSCSFFVTDNDKQKRLAHLESKHKYTDGKILNFIKL